MATMADFRYDARIPSRLTSLNQQVDPGTAAAQSVTVPNRRGSFRFPGFGRDPDLSPTPDEIIASDSLINPPAAVAPTTSTSFDDEMPGDGNVGQHSPEEGPDAAGPGGIGSMTMEDVANMAGMIAMGIPGPIGLGIGLANQALNPNSTVNQMLNPAPPAPMAKPAPEPGPATEAAAAGPTNAEDPSVDPGNPTVGEGSSPGGIGVGGPGGGAEGEGPGTGGSDDGSAAAAAAAGEAAAADAAASGNTGESGVWHEGGIVPEDMDEVPEEVPNQMMLEGEGVLPRSMVALIGGDLIEMLNMLDELPDEQRDMLAQMVQSRLTMPAPPPRGMDPFMEQEAGAMAGGEEGSMPGMDGGMPPGMGGGGEPPMPGMEMGEGMPGMDMPSFGEEADMMPPPAAARSGGGGSAMRGVYA